MISFFGNDKFLETYAVSTVYINRSLLSEHASVNVKRDVSTKPLITVHGGYSGDAPGTGIVELEVSTNVPSEEFEFDPGQFMWGSRKVEFDIYAGSTLLTFRGQIYSDNFQHAVDSGSALSFSARGRFTPQSGWWGR